eukprot:m.337930 g.337930  ORF g.337930 m.337930 type:complete len:265 (-) comp19809_c1_seq2:69-863(-)
MADGDAALAAALAASMERPDDDAIMAQMQTIQSEIKASQPLVGDREPVANLLKDYTDPVFVSKIKGLAAEYQVLRRTRGDGNCFYRAFLFGYMENLLTNADELKRVLPVVRASFQKLLDVGYPSFCEDFYETFLEQFELIEKGTDVQQLEKNARDQGIADSLVAYMRMLTSGRMKTAPDDYAPFIENGWTVDELCSQEVDPMGKEADHLQIKALSEALGVCIRVSYVDRTPGETANTHDIPDNGSEPSVHLLYRPGHYDVLYPA